MSPRIEKIVQHSFLFVLFIGISYKAVPFVAWCVVVFGYFSKCGSTMTTCSSKAYITKKKVNVL